MRVPRIAEGSLQSANAPHTCAYDEIQFIQQGRGRYTVNGETFEAATGDVLVQMDVRLSPWFIQENL